MYCSDFQEIDTFYDKKYKEEDPNDSILNNNRKPEYLLP